MRTEPEVRAQLRGWILSKAGELDPAALTDSTPLFANRILRSLHLPELLLLLERLRGEPIDVEDLRPEDFRDLDALVRHALGPQAEQPRVAP
jgi:hypothetical protein